MWSYIVSTNHLKQTALNENHRQLGARMVDFGGWEMPVQYPSGTIEEHLAVREAVGIFDVSHMGELEVHGEDALDLLQHVTCNDVARLADGQIQYSALTLPNGAFVDDILVHRFSADHFFICVNASNTDKDFNWLVSQSTGFATRISNVSPNHCQLAVQGPAAATLLQSLTTTPLDELRYYWFRSGKIAGADCLITRTGYTGEDGFELYCDPSTVKELWDRILTAGQPYGILPCGLAARNTLRLEAKMALYGHEIDDKITVFEADLGWICKLDKPEFIGRDRLIEQQAAGVTRRLAGFEVLDKGIARDGNPVINNGLKVGHVTSGSPAPFLKKNIGLALLPTELTAIGTQFQIDVRGRLVTAEVVSTPFYRRKR